MTSIQALTHTAELTRQVVRANVRDVTHAQSLIQLHHTGNCMNWVLGHLLSVYDEALTLLGESPVLPEGARKRYARGSSPITDPAEALSFEDLVAAWERSTQRIATGLSGLSEAGLEESVPHSPTGDPDETVGSLLLTVLFHQAYHAGQLGILRRQIGLPGAIG